VRSRHVCPLEPRTLFAAGAVLEASGVLFVQGTAKDDRVALFQNAAAATISAKVNGVTQSFAASAIAQVVIDTKRGNDLVEILSPIGGVIDRPVTVWTHAGNDTIVGGDGPERLNAGDDDDIVAGGGGRDTIYGGPGPGADFIRGGGGSDVINGEDGTDTIRGDTGNDHVYGGANADNLRGSAGDDVIHGGGGNDYLNGDDGDDQLFGENGIDAVDGGFGSDTLRGGAGKDVIYIDSAREQDDIDAAEELAGDIVDLSKH